MPPPDDEERGITQEQRGLPEEPVLDISLAEYERAWGTFGNGIDHGFLNYSNPGPEQVWVSNLGLAVGNCDKVPFLGIPPDPNPDPKVSRVLTFDQVDAMHRAYALSNILSGTPCLVKLARALHRNLYDVAQYGSHNFKTIKDSTRDYLKLVRYLVSIYDQIKSRTEEPYIVWLEGGERPALPKEILLQHPFHEYKFWLEILKSAEEGRVIIGAPAPILNNEQILQQAEDLQKKMEGTLLDLEVRVMDMKLSEKGLDNTPQVKKAIKALSTYSLKHIREQTGVSVSPDFEDVKLIKSTEFILYHGAYTVVLNKQGEPTTMWGSLPYPIMTPYPGHLMYRGLQGPGLFISVRKYGFGDFQIDIDNKKIYKILSGGIGGIMEVHGYFQSNTPYVYQVRLQEWLDRRGYAYAAALTVDSAFFQREVTLELVDREYPVLVETVAPYMVREVGKKAKQIYENYEEVLKKLGEAIVREAIEEMVKKKVRDFLIKKIGAKLIPFINAVAAVADLLEGDHEFIRNVIAAALLYIRGGTQDDLHISAKTMAKMLTDKFHEELMKLVINRASDAGLKLKKRGKDDADQARAEQREADDKPLETEPKEDSGLSDTLNFEPKPDPDAKPDVDSASKPDTGDSGDGDPRNRLRDGTDLDATPEEIRQAEALAEKMKAERFERIRQADTRRKAEQAAKTGDENKGVEDGNKGAGDDNKRVAHADKGTGDAAKGTGAENQGKGERKPAADDDPRKTRGDGTDDDGLFTTRKRRKKDRPPEPDEPPLPRSQDVPVKDRYAFYMKHRDQYPPAVKDRLEKMGKPTDKGLKEIDRQIREHFAAQVENHLGIPVKSAQRIPTRAPGGSGGEWERINRNLRTDKNYRLSVTSETRDKEEVQIDDFDTDRGIPIEYKASLDIPNKHPDVAMDDIKKRMSKHGRFAQERDLPAYEWVAHSQDSADKMHQALKELREEAVAMKDDPEKDNVLDQVGRITIEESFIFESGTRKKDEDGDPKPLNFDPDDEK
ncbi:hypothetical protein [Nitrosomonas ureae]|uniref:Uncharacterized protein n=1 Tax=Nitrosomonas ureae TaxID=44577 RepID=A0A1H5TLG5_9PROT|nr:hypothetical protein [Nitrosomonas ureae]SEF62951.1 hypothetical protein SAMN05216334_10516 [Nitrosomonas ureae]